VRLATPAEVATVEKEYRVYAKKEPLDSRGNCGFEHSSVIYLIGPDGRLISSYDELISPDALEKDLREKILPGAHSCRCAALGGAQFL
jgi:cytochrome oxidase Cu insertion factor (SCO1/SenC/PrrC family)